MMVVIVENLGKVAGCPVEIEVGAEIAVEGLISEGNVAHGADDGMMSKDDRVAGEPQEPVRGDESVGVEKDHLVGIGEAAALGERRAEADVHGVGDEREAAGVTLEFFEVLSSAVGGGVVDHDDVVGFRGVEVEDSEARRQRRERIVRDEDDGGIGKGLGLDRGVGLGNG